MLSAVKCIGAENVLKEFNRGEGCRDDEAEGVEDDADADGNAGVALLVEAEESALAVSCCGARIAVVLLLVLDLPSPTIFAGSATFACALPCPAPVLLVLGMTAALLDKESEVKRAVAVFRLVLAFGYQQMQMRDCRPACEVNKGWLRGRGKETHCAVDLRLAWHIRQGIWARLWPSRS